MARLEKVSHCFIPASNPTLCLILGANDGQDAEGHPESLSPHRYFFERVSQCSARSVTLSAHYLSLFPSSLHELTLATIRYAPKRHYFNRRGHELRGALLYCHWNEGKMEEMRGERPVISQV